MGNRGTQFMDFALEALSIFISILLLNSEEQQNSCNHLKNCKFYLMKLKSATT